MNQLSALDDSQLMRRVAEHDAEAFGVIYDRYQANAFSLALRITRRRGTAEEVTQDVFLNLWRAGARFDASRGSLRTWVLTLIHHRSIDVLRSLGRHERQLSLGPEHVERLEAPEHTDEEVVRDDEARRVRELLGELPSPQREAVELAYFEGLTHVEIAARVDAPLGTVKSRMRLGMSRLHKLTAQDEPEASDRRLVEPRRRQEVAEAVC